MNNEIPNYIIHLEDDPFYRWKTVIENHKNSIKKLESIIDNNLNYSFFSSVSSKIGFKLLSGIVYSGNVCFSEELKGIASILEMEVGKVLALQLIYETSTCCTSIIINGKKDDSEKNGTLIARTMDWEMEFLKELTIQLDFRMKNKSIFKAVSWAGYIGILTGISCNQFSISVNYRKSFKNSLLNNIKELVLYSWPIGYLVRTTLEKCYNYEHAKNMLSNCFLIAPCYFIVSGNRYNQGCIIARDSKNVFMKEELFNKYLIVQTNNDKGDLNEEHNILFSIQRRKIVESYHLNNILREEKERIWGLLSMKPVLNSETIYGCIMDCLNYILEVRLPDVEQGFR